MSTRKPIEAVAVFENSKHLQGFVTLKEKTTNETIISAHITGLKPNRKYAWHIHEAGDLRYDQKTKPCDGACAHYNPFKKDHGGPKSKNRHVGDLGNIITNSKGESKTRITLPVKLRGKYSVIGRSIVIHINPDDMGKGDTKESLITGSAGPRIACGVIGYSKKSQLYF